MTMTLNPMSLLSEIPAVFMAEIACLCQKSMPTQVINYFHEICYILLNECNACHIPSKV